MSVVPLGIDPVDGGPVWAAARGDSRPWPRWADRALTDPPVAGTARREPNRPGSA